MDEWTWFSAALAAEMQRAGLTQLKTAHRAGLDQVTISGILRNQQQPKLGTFIRLARVFPRLYLTLGDQIIDPPLAQSPEIAAS